MSDGSLSQDEIDALLMGDMPSEAPAAPAAASEALGQSEKDAVLGVLGEITAAQGTTLSGIMVKSVTVGAPNLEASGREAFLSQLPDEVVEIKMDYTSGLSGSHRYVLSGDDALKIAAPMIGQDNLELEDMAISAVNEAMSQITGAMLTTLGDKIDETVLTDAPEGQSVPKAMVDLPGEPFVRVSYDVQIEGQGSLTLYEIFELEMMKTLARKLGAAPQAPPAAPAAGVQGAAADADPMAALLGGAPAAGMGGAGMMGGGFGAGMQNPLNVQGVQLPELNPAMSAGEQRNIGLLMDVSMELTVELGRTKWKIKDILGMGEGTIIELDKLAGEPVDILVNNNLIARGEVVVIDENFGVRVTEIVSAMDRMSER